MRASFVLSLCLLVPASSLHAAASPPAPASAPASAAAQASAANTSAITQRAVMTGDQVVEILDETVDWYRMLGVQQQAATQPSDLLILYANRQTAQRVMQLAFEIARANAELLSSEASAEQAVEELSSSRDILLARRRLEERKAQLEAEIAAHKRESAAQPKPARADVEARISVLQRELDLVNARRNLLGNMVQFASQSDSNGFGPNALKAHINAIAASIPSSVPAQPSAAAAAPGAAEGVSLSQFGVWDLASTVFRLSAKARTIESVDARTAELEKVFADIRTPPLDRLRALTERSDQLAAQADSANAANLKGFRDQYDTLAWLFAQTSAIVTPLSNAAVLLQQYRHNLANWREATHRQYLEALTALGLRLVLFAGLLVVVFVVTELWRRAAFRYVQDTRRRSRLLLLRKIVFWALVVAIVASAFATELGSLATFAGLITAGLAVAMQSVLVSVVGYFFLIGKFGIRVGDHVQIGAVTGEVIDLGLVRMHLMELGGQGSTSPTGRVVAFPNSVIFGASGGLFKQIPGVNLAWHEFELRLPEGADYGVLKDRLQEAVLNVTNEYREDIARQTQEIQKTGLSTSLREAQPHVQLRFTPTAVDAIVRYPVQLTHAADIDERVSRELLQVITRESRREPH